MSQWKKMPNIIFRNNLRYHSVKQKYLALGRRYPTIITAIQIKQKVIKLLFLAFPWYSNKENIFGWQWKFSHTSPSAMELMQKNHLIALKVIVC